MGTLLVSVIASLIMALMVAGAAAAIEKSSDATCLAGDLAPCTTAPVEWCKSINGQMLCLGEPT